MQNLASIFDPVAFDWSLIRNGATYRKARASMIVPNVFPNLFGSLNSENQGLQNYPTKSGQKNIFKWSITLTCIARLCWNLVGWCYASQRLRNC